MCEIFIDGDNYNPSCPYALYNRTLNGLALYSCVNSCPASTN